MTYQALFALPQIAGQFVQLNAFVVDGKYAGSWIRADTTPVISGSSGLLPLIIEQDKHWK